MSDKPTPGPHMVTHGELGWQVTDAAGRTVAVFPGSAWRQSDFTAEQAAANARAFVDGMDAMETLKRIRAIEREYSESRMNALKCLQGIISILDEAKP